VWSIRHVSAGHTFTVHLADGGYRVYTREEIR